MTKGKGSVVLAHCAKPSCKRVSRGRFRYCLYHRMQARVRSARYRRTSHGRAQLKRYEGSEARKLVMRRYLASEKGKVMTARHNRSAQQREAKQRYKKTAKGRAAEERYRAGLLRRDPQKPRARNAVACALRDGRLVRKPCEVCGRVAEAHHEDYLRPLDVKWLCKRHHRAVHAGGVG